ncbi:hypothetical protein [Nostoc sp. 106C]|uniref:hypothetical protein n=1 Tax=Nostoc sp. 106C TaxID=1932667 RepID=UPI000A3832FD|nr:hypothetical protein [Nostoc sp. 106C]OUL20644.1 hypothetical protein BV375_30300 [Nostoc sp. 106C]
MLNQTCLNRPNLVKPKLDNLNFFEKAFSSARIEKYLKAVYQPNKAKHENIKKAIRLYQINMIYCESLYVSLHTLEIALRNCIDLNLSARHQSNWFFANTDSFHESILYLRNKHNINIVIPKTSTKILLECEEQKVVYAIEDSIKNIFEKSGRKSSEKQEFKIIENRDRIVANLSLGFWITLLTQNKKGNNNYFNNIFIPCVKGIFPNARNSERNTSTIQPILERILKLRNRIFHHEPIIWEYYDIEKRYHEIYRVIKWIDPTLEIWLRHDSKIDRFLDIYQSLSEEVKELTQKNITKKIQYEDRSYS